MISKKKGLRQNSERFFGRNPKFIRFFRPKPGDLKKKKKNGLRQNSRQFFSQFRNFKRLRGGYFRMGGAIFHFSQKIGLKTTKNMRFCILYKPMGGLEPPPPPLATLLLTTLSQLAPLISVTHKFSLIYSIAQTSKTARLAV